MPLATAAGTGKQDKLAVADASPSHQHRRRIDAFQPFRLGHGLSPRHPSSSVIRIMAPWRSELFGYRGAAERPVGQPQERLQQAADDMKGGPATFPANVTVHGVGATRTEVE